MRTDPVAPGSAAGRVAALAALLADETRAAMCLALLDGRAWTAGELARHARVAASTASEHLNRLVAGGVLAEERQGRHRYVRLAGSGAARLVEELAARAAPGGERPVGLSAVRAGSRLARGRTCYDHLAGRIGVALTDAMAERGLLDRDGDLAPTAEGRAWFAAQGLDLTPPGRRPVARACLDWTERRPHLAGHAGALLCRHSLDQGWCRRPGTDRAVEITPEGERRLGDLLGIAADAWRPTR
ncbi:MULTISPECIES: ArsR/SmtB family transcription factor [Streptomyces]|uniref:ArsR/SmtB family transcription factor n=1 Tax=Streptomyces TaxID=1883 RepID=UPI000C26133A|nr:MULTISPECIES: winged helix-turn-helix domain-containing protein [unclassified Streptomyces]PJM81366.1 transcriptional regulator [Streptomyces sp. TSRI0384-2]RPK87129.1 Helix-turn-helix domain protein [Streptomyces sp. ADI98-12]